MKRLIVLLMAAMLLVACGNDKEKLQVDEVSNVDDLIQERLDELLVKDELTEDDEKELYGIALNSILNEYDKEYEVFDIKTGTKLFNSIKPVADEDVEVAAGMKDSLIKLMDNEQQKVYGSFLDEIIELEETFSHLEWSD